MDLAAPGASIIMNDPDLGPSTNGDGEPFEIATRMPGAREEMPRISSPAIMDTTLSPVSTEAEPVAGQQQRTLQSDDGAMDLT